MAPKRTKSLRVLVVDDHRTFAEAIALAVGLEKDMAAFVAGTGEEAVIAAGRERPEVVLLDVVMPGMDGIETIRRILEVHPEGKVLVLSAHDDDLVKARAIEAGAVGYISKASPLTDVPALVRRAQANDPLLEPEEREELLRYLRRRRHQESTERQRAIRLTPRQTEILQLMADGMGPADIASRLHMSPLTLRTHVQNILTRLGVHTKLEAVAVAIRHGKISSRA